MFYEAQLDGQGQRLIWVKASVVDRLRAMRGPGESYSDVIIRLFVGRDTAKPKGLTRINAAAQVANGRIVTLRRTAETGGVLRLPALSGGKVSGVKPP